MKTLYCSLVRPLLEYSCETWDPHTKRNIDKLEAVQRRATRWITRSVDDDDSRLSKLKLLSLSNRRFTRDVTFFLMYLMGIMIPTFQISSYFVRTEIQVIT